ncbi:MAG: MBL fold metallo-hydrolase [Phycisphaerales bacterium]|nr:MAG: MBL fold metallo-hydrolase [Phycisphaerales bacterium]
MRRAFAALAITMFAALNTDLAGESRRTLDIYFLDMMGGGSTLIVTPLGESVLIDTGSLEPKHRDAERMHRACQQARLERIDYLITTHFDSDHYGGILELSRRIPIKRFIDKGPPPRHQQDNKTFRTLYPLYQQATKGNVTALHAGDDVPLKNDPAGRIPPIRLHCVASGKEIEGFGGDIDAPVKGFNIRRPDESENARSIALILTYGKFKFFAGGDITWNVEYHLAHPVNCIGKVDLYQVTHHGLDQSNNPTLLEALSPTVCVAMNGPKKGIQPNTFRALNALPGVKAIYQIHYNILYGDAGNTPDEFIANKTNPEGGELIKASVDAKQGTFTVCIGVDGPKREFTIP